MDSRYLINTKTPFSPFINHYPSSVAHSHFDFLLHLFNGHIMNVNYESLIVEQFPGNYLKLPKSEGKLTKLKFSCTDLTKSTTTEYLKMANSAESEIVLWWAQGDGRIGAGSGSSQKTESFIKQLLTA